MQSRKDQVQAQSFVHSRLVNAMVVADPDIADNPYRPLITGAIGSIIMAALVMVAFAIYGFLRPGGSSTWQQPHKLIVERETGSRYLYLDGKLHPVLNYTSARMLLGGAPQVVTASSKSLAIAAHGQPLGIPGAPDSLPADGLATHETWTVCAPTMADNSGRTVTVTTLSVTAGTADTATPLAPDDAALVTTGADKYVLWRGHRLRLTQPWMEKLMAADRPPVTVKSNWLQTVPVGPDIVPPEPDDLGGGGPAIDGQSHRVGELFTVEGTDGKPRYYQLTGTGMSPLTAFQYTLATADPRIADIYGGAVKATSLSLGSLARIPTAPVPSATAGLPTDTPQINTDMPSGTAWCLRQPMSGAPAEIVADKPAPPADAVPAGGDLRTTDRTADIIAVAPGLGGLYASGRFNQGPGSELFLVTDTGVRYPVPPGSTAGLLGYGAASPAPPELLNLIPTGPTLGAGSA